MSCCVEPTIKVRNPGLALHPVKILKNFTFVILAFALLSECHEWYAAPIHLARILHSPINDGHEDGQTEIIVCQVFDMTGTGIEPILPILALALPTVPQLIYQHFEA